MRKILLLLAAGQILMAGCKPRVAESSIWPESLQPYSTAAPSSTPVQPEGLVVSFETPLPTPTPFTYTVRAGDTMSGIALEFGVSLDALVTANPDVRPSAMSVGQVLKIPSNPQNSSGEFTPTPVPFPVEQIACYPTADRGMWCFVLVHNDSPDFMENVTAQVTLVGADGGMIASQTALLPLNILPPGQSLPLMVFFAPEIPADAQPRAQILTAIRLLPADERYLPAILQNTLAQVDWIGRTVQVSGQVRLPANGKAASLIWVAAVAYDDAGLVVGVRRWGSSAGLVPGGSLPFAFAVSSLAGKIARVEFAVEARP